MPIEQIIEFELRGPGPPGRATPKTGSFHDKTKLSTANLQVNYYVLQKILQEAMCLASSTWAESLTKFNLKMRDFKRVLDL